jgi:hypothetical protein
MKKNWKMSSRVVVELTSMLNFGPRTHLMNGENSMVMIKKKSIVNFFENEETISRFMDMLVLFVL